MTPLRHHPAGSWPCPAGCRSLPDAAERWPPSHDRHHLHSRCRDRTRTARHDSQSPAGRPAPHRPRDTLGLAAATWDLPRTRQAPMGALAVIEHPRRSPAGPGCAAWWRTLAAITHPGRRPPGWRALAVIAHPQRRLSPRRAAWWRGRSPSSSTLVAAAPGQAAARSTSQH